MKLLSSFKAAILSAIITGAAAINEPVASPSAAIEAEFERQLGTNIPGDPTASPRRPSGVSFFLFLS